jgi:hypothetical protein
MPLNNRAAHAWTLLPLAVLLTACGATSPRLPGGVPPLPAAAMQTDSPKFSEQVSNDIEKWRKLLTEPSSPANSASSPMTH